MGGMEQASATKAAKTNHCVFPVMGYSSIYDSVYNDSDKTINRRSEMKILIWLDCI